MDQGFSPINRHSTIASYRSITAPRDVKAVTRQRVITSTVINLRATSVARHLGKFVAKTEKRAAVDDVICVHIAVGSIGPSCYCDI
jgi:hypothetical protein